MRFCRHESLQDLCLNVIVKNLEKYIFINSIPQIQIDFLLRIHGAEVFKRFRSDQNISERAMLWFLNSYSRVIYLSTVSVNIIKRLQRMGATISYLNLKESLATENMINSILCCVPNVIKLNLSFTSCLDRTLRCIQKLCPKMKFLNLSYCSITDKGMINLCGKNQSLITLNLKGTSVTPTGILTALRGMPYLQCLRYYHFAEIFHQIHNDKTDGTTYNLTELVYNNLGNSRVTDVLQTWIALCPKLNKILISFALTYEELILCSQVESLQVLKVACLPGMLTFAKSILFEGKNDPCTSNLLGPFIQQDKLSTLILTHSEIPTKELIEGFRNLKILSLQNVTFTDFSEDSIIPRKHKLEKLLIKEISLIGLKNCKALLRLLSVSRNVIVLQLCSTKLIPQEIFDAILNSMGCLSFADFSFTPITKSTATKFFQHSSLRSLCLDGCWNILSSVDFEGVVCTERTNSLSWYLQLDDSFSDDSDENSHCDLSTTPRASTSCF